MHRARAAGQVEGAPVGAPDDLLDARHRARAQEREQVGAGERLAPGQAERDRARLATCRPRGGLASAGLAERGRGGREHGAHRVVELAQAPEAGAEGHLAEGEVGGLDEDPGGLRPLGAGERERSGTELGDEEAVEVAGAVPEPAGQAGHALPVDDPVGDEAHGPGDGVARGCSTRASRARRRAGSACTTGTRPPARRRRSAKKRTLSRLGVRAGQLGRQ